MFFADIQNKQKRKKKISLKCNSKSGKEREEPLWLANRAIMIIETTLLRLSTEWWMGGLQQKKHVNRDANKTTPERRQTTRIGTMHIYVIYIFYAGTPRTSIRRFCRR